MSDVVHSIRSRHKLEQFSRERERERREEKRKEKRREEKRREEKRREEKRKEKRREEKRKEEMEHFAKRIVPECRRATRRFQGMEGFVELRHFHKHFFKNISKNYTATF